MENLKSKILSLDVSSSVKAMLLNRVSKIKGCKVLIDDSINSVEIVPKYFKEYQKGINGRYYTTNVINMKWLNLDEKFKENIIVC
mgnify:FL=1|tara:strand:- start:407 stop:661 length:255 start_codon:yes stop_codon:yes gene_type:complete